MPCDMKPQRGPATMRSMHLGERRKSCPKKVLILGGAGWKNVGDDLIAASLKEWASRDGARVRIAGGPHTHCNAEKSLTLAGNIPSRIRLAWEILRSDYVLIGGGGLLDDRTQHFYRPFTRAAFLCRRVRTPYAFTGIGVGPIQNEESRSQYRAAAEGAHRVYVRDETSRDRLIASGVSRPIEITADPVLWGAMPLTESGGGYDLAINLRNWHTEENPKVGYDGPTDHEVVTSVAKAVNSHFGPGSKIALVSMSGQRGDDDATILSKLEPLLAGQTETFYSCEPAEAKRALSASTVVLAMRLHACLLGAQTGSKVVGLAYDPKVAQQGSSVGFDAVPLDRLFASEGGKQVSDLLGTPRRFHRNHFEAPAAPWLS